MFRLSRLRQSIFSLGARVKPTNPPQPQVVRIQRVRFRKKRPKASTILIVAGLTYAVYEIFTRGLDAWVDEMELGMTEQERQELDEEEIEQFFIPFPGFTQMVDAPPYRSTDPEWQAFLKVSRDEALLKTIRGNLAEVARRAIVNHPRLARQCGKDATVSKYWLDVQYPLRPPPTYVRQGISFGDGNGITWTQQPVESSAVFWTRQVLWPSTLTSSLWSFTSALMLQNATTIVRFFGYGSQTDSLVNMRQAMEKFQQELKKPPGKPGSASSSPPSQDRTDGGSTTSPLPSVDKRSAGSTTTPETLGTIGNAISTVSSSKLHGTRAVQEHTSGPWEQLKKKFSQKWRRPPAYPPRGAIRVSGLVEIRGSRAIVTVDCVAWWDPQRKRYDPKTLSLGLRAVRPKVQAPLR